MHNDNDESYEDGADSDTQSQPLPEPDKDGAPITRKLKRVSKKKRKQDLAKRKEVHARFLMRMDKAYAAEKETRERMAADIAFVNLPSAQWEERGSIDDEGPGSHETQRPRFEIDRISPILQNIAGEQKQNRRDIKVRSNSGADGNKMATNTASLIRSICQKSHFNNIQDSAYMELITSGMAAFCLSTDYAKDSFDQEIKLEWVSQAHASIYFDLAATGPQRHDGDWMAKLSMVTEEAYKRRWPKAKVHSMPEDELLSLTQIQYWQSRDNLRIADYYEKEYYVTILMKFSDGRVLELNEDTASILDELAAAGITETGRREVQKHRIVHYLMSGADILAGPHEVPSNTYPLFPFFGREAFVDNQIFVRGIVSYARDAQQIYNYQVSSNLEQTVKSSIAPFIVTQKQLQGEGILSSWESMDYDNPSVLTYTADPGAPPPARAATGQMYNGMAMVLQQAQTDIDNSIGYFAASKGDQQIDSSGRAITSLQRQTNTSLALYPASLEQAIISCGEVMVDTIKKVYDGDRTVDIISDSGERSTWRVNEAIIDRQTGEEVILNDLSAANFDITISTGPSYATQRLESNEVMLRLASFDPEIMALGSDLFVGNTDMRDAEALVKRLRSAKISAGLIQPNENELAELQENQKPPSQEQIIAAEMQEEGLLASMLNNEALQAAIIKTKADKVHKLTESHNKLNDALLARAEANAIAIANGQEVIPVSKYMEESFNLLQGALADAVQDLMESENTDDLEKAREELITQRMNQEALKQQQQQQQPKE